MDGFHDPAPVLILKESIHRLSGARDHRNKADAMNLLNAVDSES